MNQKQKLSQMTKILKSFSLCVFLLSFPLFANQDILKNFENESKAKDAKFFKFNATDGEKLFRLERQNSQGEKVSCMTCHTSDPKQSGMTRANKVIDPMAPAINPARFTELAKVEKWFKRNCNDVLERECTVTEKGNFIIYMMSIK